MRKKCVAPAFSIEFVFMLKKIPYTICNMYGYENLILYDLVQIVIKRKLEELFKIHA